MLSQSTFKPHQNKSHPFKLQMYLFKYCMNYIIHIKSSQSSEQSNILITLRTIMSNIKKIIKKAWNQGAQPATAN